MDDQHRLSNHFMVKIKDRRLFTICADCDFLYSLTKIFIKSFSSPRGQKNVLEIDLLNSLILYIEFFHMLRKFPLDIYVNLFYVFHVFSWLTSFTMTMFSGALFLKLNVLLSFNFNLRTQMYLKHLWLSSVIQKTNRATV